MEFLWWALGVLGGIAVLVLAVAFYCYMRVFFSPKRIPLGEDEFDIPFGGEYEAIKNDIKGWVMEYRTRPHEELHITSRDGLNLYARYYEKAPGLPIEILCHGYRGCGERDMSAGISRAFALDRNAIVIDHRASGKSDGHTITFGIKERHDCHSWIRYAIERFGDDVKLIIGGVSMGAATVMMTAGDQLPKTVICVLADCGYTSPREIICKVLKDMKLPAKVFYPFIKLGARIFGRFNLDETSPIEAMRRCTLPVVFVHGDTDDFVPHEMSVRLCEDCASDKKTLITIHGAGHGLAFPADRDGYVGALADVKEKWNLK